MQHQLNLYFPDCSTLDCRVLDIRDISLYAQLLKIENPQIKIIIPGSDCEYCFPFKIRSGNYYTSNNFGITQSLTSGELVSLPDGLYDITYSVCPNDDVFYHVKILRDCVTRCSVISQLSGLLAGRGTQSFDFFGKDTTAQRIEDLKEMIAILDGAKADVRSFRYTEAQNKVIDVNKKLSQ